MTSVTDIQHNDDLAATFGEPGGAGAGAASTAASVITKGRKGHLLMPEFDNSEAYESFEFGLKMNKLGGSNHD
jgi:hypothetical protein